MMFKSLAKSTFFFLILIVSLFTLSLSDKVRNFHHYHHYYDDKPQSANINQKLELSPHYDGVGNIVLAQNPTKSHSKGQGKIKDDSYLPFNSNGNLPAYAYFPVVGNGQQYFVPIQKPGKTFNIFDSNEKSFENRNQFFNQRWNENQYQQHSRSENQLQNSRKGFNANINQGNVLGRKSGPRRYSSKYQRDEQTAISAVNKNVQKEGQLQSTGGGFNANIKQDNKFAPTYGNIGNVGNYGGPKQPVNERALGKYKGKQIELQSESESVEDPTQTHIHYHHHHVHKHYSTNDDYRNKEQIAESLVNNQKSKKTQLQSTGGGFNTNLNQNNNFSPNFGNIGYIGGRALNQTLTKEDEGVPVMRSLGALTISPDSDSDSDSSIESESAEMKQVIKHKRNRIKQVLGSDSDEEAPTRGSQKHDNKHRKQANAIVLDNKREPDSPQLQVIKVNKPHENKPSKSKKKSKPTTVKKVRKYTQLMHSDSDSDSDPDSVSESDIIQIQRKEKKRRIRYVDDSESEELPPVAHVHHHHHHHEQTQHKTQEAIAINNNAQRQESQLQSSGGGFNANLNQDNNFSPVFGNIGNIAALQKQQNIEGRNLPQTYPKRPNKPSTSNVKPQRKRPQESSSSSSSSESSSSQSDSAEDTKRNPKQNKARYLTIGTRSILLYNPENNVPKYFVMERHQYVNPKHIQSKHIARGERSNHPLDLKNNRPMRVNSF